MAVPICLVSEHFDFSPVVHDWVNKGVGMSSPTTGHRPINDLQMTTGRKTFTQTQKLELRY